MRLPAQFWAQHLLLLENRMQWPLGGCTPSRLLAQYPHHQHSLICKLFFSYVGGTKLRHHQYQTGSYFVAEPGEPIFVPSIYSSKRNSGSVGVSRYQAFSFIPQRRVHDQCDGPKLRVGPSSPRAVITGVNSCSSFNLVQSGRYVKSLA